MKQNEIDKKEQNSYNNYIKRKRIGDFLYLVFALHIFILPNDILDKFPFLVPYTEFMKDSFAFIYQISLRISSIPQSGILYASNMVFVATVFFIYSIPMVYLRMKYDDDSIIIKIREEKILVMIFYASICYIFVRYGLINFNNGGLFDTNLRNSPSSDNINFKFGLFFRVSLFYWAFSYFTASFIIVAMLTTKTLYKKIKNLL